MPEVKKTCKKMKDVCNMKLNSHLDAGMSVTPEGGSSVKSVNVHCKCSVNIYKILLVLLGITVVAMHFCVLLKRKKKCECEE